MANVWFWGDGHRGHTNIHVYRPQFASLEEHDAVLKENYHSVVGKRDIVFFMGDAAFTKEALLDIATWEGRKILICGNHDTDKCSMRDLVEVYDKVYSLLRYKEFLLSHCPVHPAELRNKVNIHGHSHHLVIPDDRYINVCVDQTYFMPVSLHQIRCALKEKAELEGEA